MKNHIKTFFPSLTFSSPFLTSLFPFSSLFLTSLTVLTVLSANAQVPSYVPTNGLVGYWPFNGNANDESGNGNNGVSTGVNLIADRNGELNSAYEFTTNGWSPGSQLSEVYIPYNNSLNVSQISISTWIKTYDWGWPGSWGVIIARFEQGYSNPNGESWAIGVSTLSNPLNNGELRSVLIEHPQNYFDNIGNQLPVNDWIHLTVTFDGFVHKQYIDGVLAYQSSAPVGFVLNQQGTSGISIGVSDQANGHWQPYNGVIDDIGIWNRALTADEVLALYNGCNITPLAVSGNITPTQFTQETYTYPNTVGSTYNWTVTNGVILSGQGTNSIDVMWANTGIGEISVAETNATNCTGDVVTYDVVVIPTNVEELSNQLILYPNPVTTNLTLQVKSEMIGSDFVVFDALGKVVLRDKIMSSNQNISVINLSNGNYILRVGAMNKVFTISK
jgi:hypothetical protein